MPEWKKNSVAVGGSPEAPANLAELQEILEKWQKNLVELASEDCRTDMDTAHSLGYSLALKGCVIQLKEVLARARLGLSGRAE